MTTRAHARVVRARPPVAYAVVGPSFWGDGMYPPTDAVYYPLYTKCCELDLPLCMNTGIPGPPMPARGAEPDPPRPGLLPLPRAEAVHDPRRRPVVGHRHPPDDQVPQPAADDSAWSPKRLPESLLHYMRTRGKDRIIFASDYPVLSMERCLGEADALDLPDEVRDAWLYGNARRVLLRSYVRG